MSNLFKTLFLPLLVACMAYMPALGNAISISSKLDSTFLLMGKQTALHVEILQDKDVSGFFVNENSDTLCKYVEVVDRLKADTTDLGNNRIQIKRDWILQSFDSGLYVLPPLQYVVGDDTFKSSSLSLKVMPVNVDTLTNVHDYKSVESVPFHLIDFLPDFLVDYWWLFVLFIVIIAIGAIVYLYMTKKINIVVAHKPQIPPYEEAMQKLTELKERKLWQAGQEKEYYTILTDILRNYIDRRFGINAVEMTSSEIISTLRKNKETKAVNEQLEQILEIADFVKFAKVRPLPDDNEASMARAVNFVSETRPVPPPSEATENKTPGAEEAQQKMRKEGISSNHD